MTTHNAKQLLTLLTLTLLTACGGDNGKGKQNSNHGLINHPPLAKATTVKLKEDNTQTLILQATDEDNDTLGYRVTQQPKYGTLKGKAPNLSYTPNKDYNGQDSLGFIANDGVDDSEETILSLQIDPVNDAPVAKGDKVSLDEDTNITLDVLRNDKDVDKNDTLKISHIFTPSNGVATLKSDKIYYAPSPNFNGKESFNYKIIDKAGATAVATIELNIKPINDAPIAKDDEAVTTINAPIVINVLNNDTDIDNNEKLTLSNIAVSKHAKVSIEENKIHYTPNKDYTGEETLIYTIKDKEGASSQASVKITVRELNDEEKYAQLEDSGVIPKLDRSDNLGGTDSDNNGIRDDVDDYINKQYTDPKEKAAAQQMARAYQEMLLVDKNDIKKVREVAKKTTDAVVCTVDTAPTKGILRDMKSVTLNTKLRVREFFIYDDLLDGSVTSMPRGDTCEK